MRVTIPKCRTNHESTHHTDDCDGIIHGQYFPDDLVVDRRLRTGRTIVCALGAVSYQFFGGKEALAWGSGRAICRRPPGA
jgi:hypothetical protein